jgi:hypothetical protein
MAPPKEPQKKKPVNSHTRIFATLGAFAALVAAVPVVMSYFIAPVILGRAGDACSTRMEYHEAERHRVDSQVLQRLTAIETKIELLLDKNP